jgi:molecular chaperone GrpE
VAQDRQEESAAAPENAEQAEVAAELPPEQGAEAEAVAELQRVQRELEQTRAKAAEYLDGWQRAQAEFANYRKRQESERAQLVAFANAALLRKLLPVVDDFERAIGTLPASGKHATWAQGVLLITRKLETVLESEGVKEIETQGRDFDPAYHEAVTYEQADGYRDGQIIGVVQRGYVMGERVLRPAQVRVAQAPVALPKQDSHNREDKE